MILKVLDRITLLGILPEQGDFLTLKLVRQLREDLSFSEHELEAMSIQNSDGRITWNPEADAGKPVSIGKAATELIACGLKKLDKEQKLTDHHVDLYSTFVGE
jgi:hypothetical protein